jgi:hypothetical protein
MINIVNDISDDEEKLNDIYGIMINRICELDKIEQDNIDTTTTPIEKLTERFEKILRSDRYEDQEDFVNQWKIYINTSLYGLLYLPTILMILIIFIGYILHK